MPYVDRLAVLRLESLELRRLKADLIFLYKIIHDHGLVDIVVCLDYFSFNNNYVRTRSHQLKINVQYSRTNIRKNFFINRVIPIWNSLDTNVVSSSSLNVFKASLKNCNLSNRCRGRAHTAT